MTDLLRGIDQVLTSYQLPPGVAMRETLL